jgi:hypothetical protein
MPFLSPTELFRDYGFIESFPQRWHVYVDKSYQWDLDVDGEGQVFMQQWDKKPKDANRMDRLTTFLKKDIRRLRRLKNVICSFDGQPASSTGINAAIHFDIPKSEWKTIWEFVDATLVAFTTALDYLNKSNFFEKVGTRQPTWPIHHAVSNTYHQSPSGSHYDPWFIEPDDNAYGRYR